MSVSATTRITTTANALAMTPPDFDSNETVADDPFRLSADELTPSRLCNDANDSECIVDGDGRTRAYIGRVRLPTTYHYSISKVVDMPTSTRDWRKVDAQEGAVEPKEGIEYRKAIDPNVVASPPYH